MSRFASRLARLRDTRTQIQNTALALEATLDRLESVQQQYAQQMLATQADAQTSIDETEAATLEMMEVQEVANEATTFSQASAEVAAISEALAVMPARIPVAAVHADPAPTPTIEQLMHRI